MSHTDNETIIQNNIDSTKLFENRMDYTATKYRPRPTKIESKEFSQKEPAPLLHLELGRIPHNNRFASRQVLTPQQKYLPVGKIGEGTYGLVYKARSLQRSNSENFRHPHLHSPLGAVAPPNSAIGPSHQNVSALPREVQGHNLPSVNASNPIASVVASYHQTGRCVAVKKFKSFKSGDGISPTAIREIKLLRELSHRNIVHLIDVMLDPKDKSLYLVFDYADHDLLDMIRHHHTRQGPPMDPVTVKSLLWQILKGIRYLHRNWIIHRDLKPSNILVTGVEDVDPKEKGCVKIADFGLARLFQAPLKPFPDVDSVVVTIWYRAPELLLGAKHYTCAVDLWAIGCIFAELLTSKPLFQGQEKERKGDDRSPFQVDQVDKIFRTLGKPTSQIWPGIVNLPHWKEAETWADYPNTLLQKVSCVRADSAAFSLLTRLLEYDPEKRITAEEALEHPYFQEEPLPQLCAFVNEKDPYKSRPVTPLDPKKDMGWAVNSSTKGTGKCRFLENKKRRQT